MASPVVPTTCLASASPNASALFAEARAPREVPARVKGRGARAEVAWIVREWGEDDDPIMAIRIAEAVIEDRRSAGARGLRGDRPSLPAPAPIPSSAAACRCDRPAC